MDERELDDALMIFVNMWRAIDAQIAWLVAFGALDNPHVRLGLAGAIVGAPADPEAFG